MKKHTIGLILLIVLAFLVAGCISQSQQKAETSENIQAIQPIETTTEITSEPTQETHNESSISDPVLSGTWYLKLMSEQNGTAQVQTLNPEITVTFEEENLISGNSGCNTYSGEYTLTGKNLQDGKGISISPLITTRMNCQDSMQTEKTYLEILQASTCYLINVNLELSLMDNEGNTLVYQKQPYNETAVPQGT